MKSPTQGSLKQPVQYGAPDLFDPKEISEHDTNERSPSPQDIRMTPFHLALMLASKDTTPRIGEVAYFGMKPGRASALSREKAIPGRIEDWRTIHCNDKACSSLREAVVESRKSQGNGRSSSANGWKATYVPDPFEPNKYRSLLEQFRESFLQGLLLDEVDHHLLMEPEYLALFLVRKGLIEEKDAFETLASMGYVNQRFARFPELERTGSEDAIERRYWASLGRSHRTWRGNITKRAKLAAQKKDAKAKETAAVLGVLDQLEQSEYEEIVEREVEQLVLDLEEEVEAPEMPKLNSPDECLKEGEMYSFTGETVGRFEQDVLRPQVPGYTHMRKRVLSTSLEFISENENRVLDIGCSRGEMFKEIFRAVKQEEGVEGLERLLESSLFIGIDIEDEMIASAESSTVSMLKRVGIPEEVAYQHVNYEVDDITQGVLGDFRNQSLITSILTIQFTPIEYRQAIIKQIYDALKPGGAFIWVEKIRANSYFSEELLTKLYYDSKDRNGMSREAIDKKRRAIERFLVPETNKGNKALLQQAGFDRYKTTVFWRDLQFAAYLAVK